MQSVHTVGMTSGHTARPVYAPPITNMLPHELFVGCLVQLDTFDRVRATCVCRAWRAIALCATELWADVSGTISWFNQIKLLSLVILRSGSRPLDVDLQLNRSYRSYLEKYVSKFLLPRIARIRHLRIDGHSCVSLYGCDAPLLETVHVDARLVLPRAARLREVHAGTLVNIHSRFNCLMRLRTGAEFPYVFNSLHAYPNIVSLDLALERHRNDHVPYSPQYRGPVSLVDLKLTCTFMDASLFLQHFHSCAALRTVHLIGGFSFPCALALYEAVGHTVHTFEVGQLHACLSSDTDAGVSLRLDRVPRSFEVCIINTVSIMPTVRRLVATSFYALGYWNEPAMMPALESISFSSPVKGLLRLAASGYVLRAPNLRSVVFYCDYESDSESQPRAPPRLILRLLACVMRYFFGCSQFQLDSLRFEGLALADTLITEEDVQPIFGLAQHVFHGTRALHFSQTQL